MNRRSSRNAPITPNIEESDFAARLERKKRKRSLIWGGSALLLLIIISTITILSLNRDPIPTAIRDSVKFPLYYPTSKPAGYAFKKTSIRSSNNVVRYDLTNAKSPAVDISQQPLPKNFDPKQIFAHSNVPTTISPLGTVYELSFKNQSRYMIVTTTSLIFITSTPTITNSQLQDIVNDLSSKT